MNQEPELSVGVEEHTTTHTRRRAYYTVGDGTPCWIDLTDSFPEVAGRRVLRYGMGGFTAEQLRVLADYLDQQEASA